LKNKQQLAVFFDEIPFLGDPNGGIARYTVELQRMLHRSGVVTYGCIAGSSHLFGGQRPSAAGEWMQLPGWLQRSSMIRIFLRRAFFLKLRFRRREGLKVAYHSTGIGSDPWIAKEADVHVHTIHDLIPEKNGTAQTLKANNAIFQRKKSLETAKGVLWVSQRTKKDFRWFYPENKLLGKVVPHGRPGPVRKGILSDPQHFLIVGKRGGYKNIEAVYHALSLFPKSEKRPLLRLIGGGKPSDEEENLWDSLGIRNLVHWSETTEDEMPGHYRKAYGLCYPSRWEGFGFPALEAMTYGCPVIYAEKSGVEDLVGKAGCPLSEITPSELYKAMRKFFVSRQARSRAISRGYKEASKFSWDATVRATLSFYKFLLKT
jgi:glycosyltransferase involved in cell wall biosynthesis